MYKAAIRAMLRHSINRLNQGDYTLLLKSPSNLRMEVNGSE